MEAFVPMDDDLKAPLFRFTCRECDVGDGAWGHLATFDDNHCMVCHMDDGRSRTCPQPLARRAYVELSGVSLI